MNYEKILSSNAQMIKPSGIRKFFDIMNDMDDVISLTVGQPDFVTPWHIREAAIRSLEKGKTYYTSNSGLPEMRNEISLYLERRFGMKYDPNNEIVVTVGGSEAIDIAIRTVVNPGDEVIIPTPSFVCYTPIVQLCNATPVILETEEKDNFKIDPERLKSLITKKTKLIVLPFPNNPTGAIMTKEELENIAKILRGTDIMILSDEIYAELTYGKPHCSISTLEGMRERTIVVNGFSKAYAMTGWRMGYVCAPKEITKHLLKIHQFAIMCAPTVSQYAAVEALKNGDEDIDYMKAEYNRRRRLIVDGLNSIGLKCFEPEGAFYVFPRLSDFGMDSNTFCERLIYEKRIAIVPGTAFGDCGEGYARISYAYSIKHIEQALERIESFIKEIK
ncbi:MAG: aminotransferase class I/II-fold pyridoxal phosphate-dependent enzyme [Ruminococcaceae bacterium]|nr:aminotransferase class I/II-fold pyridoxal phosphate-dependent enzyme [Oscillospiraceae bacterium]